MLNEKENTNYLNFECRNWHWVVVYLKKNDVPFVGFNLKFKKNAL
jgi:hypothetical protein